MSKRGRTTLWGRIARLLEGGHSPDASLDAFRKALMLNLLLGLGSVFLVLLGVLAVFQGKPRLALADGAAFILLTSLLVWVRRARSLDLAAAVGALGLGAFFLFLFVFGGVQGTAYVWCFTFPLVVVFILGVRAGIASSVLLLLAILVVWFGYRHVGAALPYSGNLMLRFVPTYFTILLLALAMERVREVTHVRMEGSRDELSDTIVELKEAQRELREQAIRDGLTGLYNRRFFDEIVETVILQAQRHGSQFSVLMVDVDHFKAYNDTLGHPQGDEALRQVGAVLRASVRRRADMVFRYGGEEFVALLTDTIDDASRAIAGATLEAMRTMAIPHPAAPAGIVTVSIGVAHWTPDNPLDAQAVVARADHALYCAKKSGRNRFVACDDEGNPVA